MHLKWYQQIILKYMYSYSTQRLMLVKCPTFGMVHPSSVLSLNQKFNPFQGRIFSHSLAGRDSFLVYAVSPTGRNPSLVSMGEACVLPHTFSASSIALTGEVCALSPTGRLLPSSHGQTVCSLTLAATHPYLSQVRSLLQFQPMALVSVSSGTYLDSGIQD